MRAARKPRVADARYRLLIDPGLAYDLRRHCDIGWQEFEALPWYEQRAIREGIGREFYGQELDPAAAESNLRELGVTFIQQ